MIVQLKLLVSTLQSVLKLTLTVLMMDGCRNAISLQEALHHCCSYTIYVCIVNEAFVKLKFHCFNLSEVITNKKQKPCKCYLLLNKET